MEKFDKNDVQMQSDKLMQIREEFYSFLDKNLQVSKNGGYDFSTNPTLNAKEVYEHFFKLDYQARKLRGILVKTYELN